MSNGLLAEVLESPLCAKLLSDGIVGSLSTIMANEGAWKDVTNEDSSLLKTMCLLLQHMTKLKGRSMQNTYKDLSKATSLLQKFASQFVKDGEEKALVEETIQILYTVAVQIPEEIEQRMSSSHLFDSNRTSLDNATMMKNKKIEELNVSNKGAGAILHNRLCHVGWKFPSIAISTADTHYLSDLEIKIKLGHANAYDMLCDCVADFPSAVILANTGIVHALLDVVGGCHSSMMLSDDGDDNGFLDSIKAMQVLKTLMLNSVASYMAYHEGSVCSTYPTIPSKIDNEMNPAPTLAQNLTDTINALRYPNVDSCASNDETDLYLQNKYGSNDYTFSSTLVSLSGLAFAISAAVLPLLKTNDSTLLKEVISTLEVSLKYIIEPHSTSSKNNREESKILDMERARLQHLLNRMEHLLVDLDYSIVLSDFVRYCTALSHDHDMFAADHMIDIVDSMHEISREMGLCKVILSLICQIPLDKFRPKSADMNAPQATESPISPISNSESMDLVFSNKTVSLIRDVCVHCDNMSKLVGTPSEVQHCWNVLKSVNRFQFNALVQSRELIAAVNELAFAATDDGRSGFPVIDVEAVVNKLEMAIDITQFPGNKSEQSTIVEIVLGLYLASYNVTSRNYAVYNQTDLQKRIAHLAIRILCGAAPEYRTHFLTQLVQIFDGNLSIFFQPDSMSLDFYTSIGVPLDGPLSVIDIFESFFQAWFVDAVLMGGIYTLNCEENDDSGSIMDLVNAAMSVLHSLFLFPEELTKRILHADPERWSKLLGPLRLLSWGLDGLKVDMVFPESFYKFIDSLDRFCASESPHAQSKNIRTITYLMGLFHTSSSVREESLFELQKSLKFISTSAIKVEGAPQRIQDMFSSESNWLDIATKATSGHSNSYIDGYVGKALYEVHTDIKKLAALAYGSDLSDTNVAALRQLRSIVTTLSGEALATADWALEVTVGALDTLASFLKQSKVNRLRSPTNPPVEDIKVILEAAIIFRTMISKSHTLREQIAFNDDEDEEYTDDIYYSGSLMTIINLALEEDLYAFVMKNDPLYSVYQVVLFQILNLFAMSETISSQYASRFQSKDGGFEVQLFSNSYLLQSHVMNDSKYGLQIPSQLASSFTYPSKVNKFSLDSAEYETLLQEIETSGRNNAILLCQLKYTLPNMGTTGLATAYSKRDIVDVKRASDLSDYGSVSINWVHAIFPRLSYIESTTGLASMLKATATMMSIVPNLGAAIATQDVHGFIKQCLDVFQVTRENIDPSLTYLFEFLYTLQSGLKLMNGNTLYKVNTIDETCEKINKNLADFFGYLLKMIGEVSDDDTSPSYTSSGSTYSKARSRLEKTFVKQFKHAHSSILSLLQSIVDSPQFISSTEKLFDTSDTALLCSTLEKYAYSKSDIFPQNNLERVTASSTLYALISAHDTYSSIYGENGCKSFKDFFGQVSLVNIVDSIHTVRRPDSFQNFGLFLQSLKFLAGSLRLAAIYPNDLLYVGKSNINQSKWPLRLLHDRRSEVRLLSLQMLLLIKEVVDIPTLFDHVMAMMTDRHESTAVKLMSFRVLLVYASDEQKSHVIAQFLCTIEPLLNTIDASVNISTISIALSSLSSLLGGVEGKKILETINTLNLVPLLMRLCHGELHNKLEKTLSWRLGCDANTSVQSKKACQSVLSGWDKRTYDGNIFHNQIAWETCKISLFRILSIVESMDAAAFHKQAIDCRLIEGLAFELSKHGGGPILDNSGDLTNEILTNIVCVNEAKSRSFAALMDLLSTVLSCHAQQATAKRSILSIVQSTEKVIYDQVDIVLSVLELEHPRTSYLRTVMDALSGYLATLTRVYRRAFGVANNTNTFDFALHILLKCKTIVVDYCSMYIVDGDGDAHLNGCIDIGLGTLVTETSLLISEDIIRDYFAHLVQAVGIVNENPLLPHKDVTSSDVSHKEGHLKPRRKQLNKVSTQLLCKNGIMTYACLRMIQGLLLSPQNRETTSALANQYNCTNLISSLLATCVSMCEVECARDWKLISSMFGGNDGDGMDLFRFIGPSLSELTHMVLTTMSAYAQGSLHAKISLLGDHENRYNSNNLQDITKLAMSPKLSQRVKVLATVLISDLIGSSFGVRTKNHNAMSRIAILYPKYNLYNYLNELIRKKPTRENVDMIAAILDALGSCCALETIQNKKKKSMKVNNRSSPRAKENQTVMDGNVAIAKNRPYGHHAHLKDVDTKNTAPNVQIDMKLLVSLWRKYKSNTSILHSIVSFLGKEASTYIYNEDYSKSDANIAKRMPPRVTSMEALSILADINTLGTHPALVWSATCALWSILQGSEQARANFKKCVSESKSANLEQVKAFYTMNTILQNSNVVQVDMREVMAAQQELHTLL
jgi:hypothetical protein